MPAGLEGEQLRARRDADDALAVVRERRDDAGNLSSMQVALEAAHVVVDEIAARDNAPLEIRMLRIDTGVDDGDAYAFAHRPAMRFGNAERTEAPCSFA